MHLPETANITGLISKPPSPSYAVEGKNFTLEWTYTLDGTLSFALFAIANADGSDLNIGSSRSPGSVTIQGQFQARFRAHVTDTRAELTILAVQRSDEEKYKINIIATSADSVSEAILLVVNSKYWLKYCVMCYSIIIIWFVYLIIVTFYLDNEYKNKLDMNK